MDDQKLIEYKREAIKEELAPQQQVVKFPEAGEILVSGRLAFKVLKTFTRGRLMLKFVGITKEKAKEENGNSETEIKN